MIDHISIAVTDLKKSGKFYDAVFSGLGMARVADRAGTIGYGKKYPEFWLNSRLQMAPVAEDCGSHVCLRARSEEIVRRAHEAALAGGGSDAGAPGPRQGELTPYFGAFFKDPDGNKIEIVTFPVVADSKG
ncbi:VOC family protein [Sneathiella sp.]|uniref:VOC family protein n=1 Tax=Sneathiella sp. TaxID=1964365 RepID=UPI003562792A